MVQVKRRGTLEQYFRTWRFTGKRKRPYDMDYMTPCSFNRLRLVLQSGLFDKSIDLDDSDLTPTIYFWQRFEDTDNG